jgi:hypothetical protein
LRHLDHFSFCFLLCLFIKCLSNPAYFMQFCRGGRLTSIMACVMWKTSSHFWVQFQK